MEEKKIQLLLRKFAKDRNWEKFHSLKNLAISINLEASELLELFQWEDLKINAESKNKISEEIADIMLYLLRFADIAKINIEEACISKIKINEEKYPIQLSKGNSLKYNKLKDKNC